MAFLYLNKDGRPVSIHSYSGGETFRSCRRKYKLSRIDGWKEREDKASTKFGAAVESAIQFFHSNKCVPNSGVSEFRRIWSLLQASSQQPAASSLTYTDQEGSWEDLQQMGTEMLTLYEIQSPSLPFARARFQLSYKKEVFPGTELSGIEFSSYIDLRCEPQWDHPLLPTLEASSQPLEASARRALIVDIKTSKAPLDDTPGLIALDPQLREYAWVTGIRDVAFLWLIKARPGNLKKGDEVSIIKPTPRFDLGDRAIVLDADVGGLIGILPHVVYDTDWATSDAHLLKGKKLEEAKFDYVEKHGAFVASGALTKQRIQFMTARLSEEDVHEAGELIGREIADIVRAKEENFYPKDSGVRFPNNKCSFCSFLGICTNNPKMRDEHLINISTKPAVQTTGDWLDELAA